MFAKLSKLVDSFSSKYSAAEIAWKLLTALAVTGSGTTAGLLARGTEFFIAAGPLAWFAIGLLAALITVLIFYLIKLAYRQSAEATYMQALAQPRSSAVNPLSANFADQVIYLPDLYLPREQLHSNKQFKRCKIVGPGAIAMRGGTYIRTNFLEAGSVIVLPDSTVLTGVLILDNCTVEDCELIGITLLTNKPAGETFKKMGAPVVGL